MDLCDRCEHPRSKPAGWFLPWLREQLHLREPAPECGHLDIDESGWGSTPCRCRDEFHHSEA